jgi:hypothetical protein
MKKIFIALLIIFPLAVFSQGTNVVYKKFVTDAICSTDSAFSFTVSENYSWQILIKWSANDGTTSTVKIQQSVDGSTWLDYGGVSATTLTTAAGYTAYEDDVLTGNKIRVLFTVQSGKKATLNCWYNLKRR